ncbi:MAG: flagellar basal body P-ring formation chaperone FlgA [Kangiellaceae bacterium]|nr:flagellar basal body P-ring formation chaperone FlgA [Kangiellaceae bacterium]MCW9017994.1 flagellar basal body P-ring formation chaperone FlgA [Kangiellaceae bacterium]
MKNFNQINLQANFIRAGQRQLGLFLVVLLIASNTNLTFAKDLSRFQPVESIVQAAKIFLEEKQHPADKDSIRIIVSNIDPRTRLTVCDRPLEAFLAPGMKLVGKTTVGVMCPGQKQWKIYVPAKVEKYVNVWVANRNLSTSDIISKADMRKRSISIDRLRKSPMENSAALLNTSPKRVMREGSVFFQDSVCMVCRGQKVNVSAVNEYLTIFVEGVALSDAILGETVQIRNSQSKRVFGAIVTGKDQLSVKLTENR